MGSLVEENSINSLNNQISGGSRSSILLSKVEFKNIEDDNDMMSTKTLQNKYNVLTNDNKFSFNNNINSNELVIKMNGQNKICSNNSLMNGNTSDNSNDGIPVPKHVLFPPERVLLDWKESRPIGAGLTNLGNTCFLNSVLQCLTYCPPLVNYILHSNDHNSNKCNNQNNNFCMICEMSRHIRQTRNHCGEAIKPINICRRLKSIAKHFTFGRQEDAHEFLRYVIDNMWKSSLSNNDLQNQKLDPLSKETTAINQIFGGYHRSQVICLQCKAKSNTYDYFMDFMLDIKNVSSLEKALDKFVAPEILQQEEAYKCTRCKRKVLAKKQFTVFKAPNVATFQFKRFDYNRMFGGKISKPISYPEKLDLRPYMSDNKGPPILYKLNSVLVHLGPTCNSGHYFCYVRNSNNSWYLMDDSRVIQTNQNSALNQGQAYVLFYVRIDTDFHRPTPMKNFISQSTPNGIKLSNISSPELFRNQKLNNFGTINNSFTSAQTIRKLNSPNDALKAIPSDVIKQTQNFQRKQNNCEKNNNQIKGLVPYASDSSDDESPKSTNHLNGSLNSNCDKTLNNSKLSTNELNSNQSQKNSSKAENEENSLPNVKTNSNQTIPNPKPKISINFQQNLTNHTSESSSCVPLAPITLKVKATTPSSWHVVESALRSPSIASNSSTNSVNSTTEWTVSECKPDCNGKQHSKHKHKNKQNKCLSTANGNVTQFLSSKEKLPQNGQQINQFNGEPKNSISEPSTQISEIYNKFESTRNQSPKKCSDNETNISVNFSIETIESKEYCNQRADHFDRKSVSSHRSFNDSQRDDKRRSKERDRSHSKSINSDESTCSAHKHEKRKSKSSSRKSSESDSKEEKITIKIKHKKKKKKLKKQKHKKRDRSDSESYHSDDSQLQWIERTKETVEKERNCDPSKLKDSAQVAETAITSITSNSSTNNIFVRKWDQNVGDLAKKRSLEEDIGSERTNNQINCNNNAVNELLKNGRGFGVKVNSWNGEPSTIEVSLNEDKRQNNDLFDDDYDEEFDRGKTKKVKTHNKNERFYDSTHNPFQKLQSDRYRFNGSFSSHPNKPEFERHFKGNNNHTNNHKSWNPYHKRHDKERRH